MAAPDTLLVCAKGHPFQRIDPYSWYEDTRNTESIYASYHCPCGAKTFMHVATYDGDINDCQVKPFVKDGWDEFIVTQTIKLPRYKLY